jgi:hypothetical protein
MRSPDNGKEFMISTPYSPQQNGKYKDFCRLIEMALKASDLFNLVAECNRTPHFELPLIQRTRGMKRMTPREV